MESVKERYIYIYILSLTIAQLQISGNCGLMRSCILPASLARRMIQKIYGGLLEDYAFASKRVGVANK